MTASTHQRRLRAGLHPLPLGISFPAHSLCMTEGVLSFPFRLTPQGEAAIAPYGSDQEVREAIAALTLTYLGERLLSPEFGITDPAWNGIDPNDVQAGLDNYGPVGVTVTGVEEEPVTETQTAYVIEWSHDDEETP